MFERAAVFIGRPLRMVYEAVGHNVGAADRFRQPPGFPKGILSQDRYGYPNDISSHCPAFFGRVLIVVIDFIDTSGCHFRQHIG